MISLSDRVLMECLFGPLLHRIDARIKRQRLADDAGSFLSAERERESLLSVYKVCKPPRKQGKNTEDGSGV